MPIPSVKTKANKQSYQCPEKEYRYGKWTSKRQEIDKLEPISQKGMR